MANKRIIKPELMQKILVLSKLYESGCRTEKALQGLHIGDMLRIPDITIPDIHIILDLQKQTKGNKLFSYLGGEVIAAGIDAPEDNLEQHES